MANVVTGTVQTVLGPIDPSELGRTLPHEHVIKDSSDRFAEPDDVGRRAVFHAELDLATLHHVTYGNFGAVRDNTRLTDEATAAAELVAFREAGGGTVCDLTSGGMNGDPAALARVSAASGVHVVAGCGWYLGRFHPARIATLGDDELAGELIDDLAVGLGDTGIRAGVIGEIGTSWPVGETELKVLRAAVIAQRETGAGLSIHPSPNAASPRHLLSVLEELGARLDRVVVCHMDRCGYERSLRLDLLASGCFVEYDTFGYHVHPVGAALAEGALPSMLNDVARVAQVVELVELGYRDQLLLSHDLAFRHALTAYGGQGYRHLLVNLPAYFEAYGLPAGDLDRMTIDNPRRLLTFD